MKFKEGEWVSFSHIYGFVLAIDEKKQQYLVQFRNNGEQGMKWVPMQMLESREEVRLLEEDIGELQSLAISLEDFEWFGELEWRNY
ncbi:hypothetical protein [Lysinibacillus sp. LZ02]|uniref:hypothetical protein n=1 Tax=Lysinibacillus sp. LZ02 TaxID=3420668 RepID=UPI003D35B1C0